MAERTASSIRARVRAELVEEIKAIAREQIATDGAGLSLRAVARDLNMASSAIYRYFGSRDELLTALIIDAYNSLGEVTELADAAVPDRSDLLGRWLATANALRDWSLARPHEYALIYGSPVPGYAAPEDTVQPSTRPVLVLGAILADAHRAGRLVEGTGPPVAPELAVELAQVAVLIGAEVNPATMARAMIAWTELFGAISFEVFGRLNNVIDQRAAWYDHQARTMAALVGLG